MEKIKNVIFDFGCVLVYWNQHNLYDAYFGSSEKTDWFIQNICTVPWNNQTDMGVPIAQVVEEKIAEHPEWEKEIRMYWDEWDKMLGTAVEGMEEWVRELKQAGYGVYGLTNWSAETFPIAQDRYPVFGLLNGIVISGVEKIAKPDLRLYQILLDRYELNANECVFIDDRQENVDAAEALGIKGIVFKSCEQAKKEFEAIG
ncbi:MAG: HAD family phosphatase [Paludibacteraceae bacterium]|nr:HAD family phosphatase [Paludibacteraceae bacterium]